MIVDSGVWIDHFLDRTTPTVTFLRAALRAGRAVFLTPSVLQEVLQGTRDTAQFARYERLLALIAFAQIGDARDAAVIAGNLYARLRWSGVTVPSQDCQIAAHAVCSGEPLLTCDADFDPITQIEPRLHLLAV